MVQGTLALLNDAVTMTTDQSVNAASLAVQIAGTWTGTVSFETTIDGGTTWNAIKVVPINGTTGVAGAAVATATANGQFYAPNMGFGQFRVRLSTLGTGSATVSIDRGIGNIPSSFWS